MKRLTSLAALASIGLVNACAAKTQEPPPDPTPAPFPASASAPQPPTAAQPPAPGAPPPSQGDVDANLKALRDLGIFEVQGIVEHIPEQANCYNVGCPGHEQEFADAKARAAAALATFTRTALDAAASTAIESTPAYSEHCYTQDDANLAALKALDVVALGDVVLEAPESYQAGNCYSVIRARKLARIAVALEKP
jgi:hypothetical protein